MYCQTCGSVLAHNTKFCNRCGTQLVPTGQASADKTAAEKRLDEYLDGLFWISVFGLAFIIGGTVLLTKIGVRDLIVLGYAVLSTIVFLINFGLSLWGALSIMRSSKDGKLTMQPGHDTRELGPPKIESLPITATSVTEHTTRSFEPLEHKQVR
ncbi:MAG: zinc ribbon domain-containing protein [Acidobacteria bacterium]|nr:zinc ribbon domain-containing protein [Acidobacteriota bacterium]